MPKPERLPDPTGPLETSKQALEVLAGIEEHVDRLLEPVKNDLERVLLQFVGKRFSSYDANRSVLRKLLRLLDRLNMGLVCQSPGCGKPARLRCIPSMGRQPWTFQFEHYIEGKTVRHCAVSMLPPLKLVRLEEQDQRQRVKRRDGEL